MHQHGTFAIHSLVHVYVSHSPNAPIYSLSENPLNYPAEGARAAFETMRAEMGEAALKQRAMPEFGYTNEQMFFVAIAQLYCDKDLNNHEYLAAEMTDDDDPHSSGNVRVNAMAMQMTEFAEAFHCQPDDPMVTDEDDKCYLLPTE